MGNKKLASKKKKSKKSRNKSSTCANANPLSAQQGSSSSAQTAAAPAVASPSVANIAAAPVANIAAAPVANTTAAPVDAAPVASPAVASPLVANTTAAPAPAQRLYDPCSVEEYLKNPYGLNEEQFKRGGQSILRSLIGKVAHLGLKGITQGCLTAGNILVIGNKAENLEVEILDTPQKKNQALPSYREQFRTLASEMVKAWKATCPLASHHFFEMLEYCIPWFYFKQLEWHPLLLSSHEVAVFVFHLYTHLEVVKEGWKINYRKLITRENVDLGKIISGTGRGALAFSKVYSYPKKKKNSYSPAEYEQNPLGALELYRHSFSHVNDHMWDHFVEKNAKSAIQLLQKPQAIPADALLTQEEIENALAQAFPEVPLELFNYMLYKHYDINAAIA